MPFLFGLTILLYLNQLQEAANPECVYWRKNGRKGGVWVNDGCSVDKSEHGFTVCECDHLTNFALLMVNIAKSYTCS